MPVDVHPFACLTDNYGFLVRDRATGESAAIDTPDADAVLRAAEALGWRLTMILNTHWHPDHAGGNAAVRAATGARAIGPEEVRAHFPLDEVVAAGDNLKLGETPVRVMAGGGHTLGHIVYHLPDDHILFAGDTLFPMGCGRVFEGTPDQMWTTLSDIAALPADTTVYSAHEYGEANARFALSVDADEAVAARAAEIAATRARGEPTVPTTIARERDTNPFLRAGRLPIAAGAATAAEAFARVRAAKDAFKG